MWYVCYLVALFPQVPVLLLCGLAFIVWKYLRALATTAMLIGCLTSYPHTPRVVLLTWEYYFAEF